MKNIADEKDRKPTGLMFKRLDISAIHAEGFFLRKAIAQNEIERNALAQIFRRNPTCFDKLVDRSGVYRVTQDYLSKRKMLQLLKSYDTFGPEPLRRALWSLFIIEHRQTMPFREEGQIIEGIHCKVDDFSSDHAGFGGMIITVPQRSLSIKARTFISPLIKGKIVRVGLDRYLSEMDGNTLRRSMEALSSNFLPGGIWPESEDECHDDQREYPGWSAPVSGRTKWRADREILEKGITQPGYIFGVYPI